MIMLQHIRVCSYLFACIGVVLMLGCSTLNVDHLAPQRLDEKATQSQQMKFWVFEYTYARNQTCYRIKGNAHPRSDRLPTWGTWLSDLEFTAYLCDQDGKVLIQKNHKRPPCLFSPTEDIPFDFSLPAVKNLTPMAITFGYRMVIQPKRPSKNTQSPLSAKNTQVFFASQGALQQ